MVTIEKLRERARLIRAWEKHELGQPSPGRLDYMDTARLMDDAADLIEGLRSDLEGAALAH